jgi:hypothetical protein
MPRTALVVPVPEAAPYFTGAPGLPAHVTILFPFAEPAEIDLNVLRDLISLFPAFDFELDRIEVFEDGTRWLRPAPATTFIDLTAAVMQRWPGYAPYEGAHDSIIPHVTITAGDVPVPIACRATEVVLLEEDEPGGGWATRLAIPLR